MALVECHECGNEISTEAKTCPKCGAKNKGLKKSSAFRHVVGIILLAVLIYWVYDYMKSSWVPNCQSDTFRDTFEGSPYAQKNKLRVIDVTDRKEVSQGSLPEDTVCEITFRLNDATTKTYIFTFEPREDGSYFVRGKPK
jgi:hypothetical protein